MSDQEWPSASDPGDGGDAGATPPPPPPPPAPGTPAAPMGAGVGAPADLGIRFAARLVDGVLLVVVWTVVAMVVILPILFTGASRGFPMGGGGMAGFVSGLIGAVLFIGYHVWFESARGATVGKQLLGLQVRGPAGGNPTLEEAFRRNLWMALGIIPLLGGLLQLAAAIYIAVTISSATDKRGWHDQFGNTAVVRIK